MKKGRREKKEGKKRVEGGRGKKERKLRGRKEGEKVRGNG